MKRVILAMFALGLFPIVTVASLDQDLSVISRKAKKMEKMPTKPVEEVRPAGPFPEAIGKPIKWVADNAVKPDGWQITGYSKLKIHEDNSVSRLKIGIINPELDAGHDWSEFERWQDQLHQNRNEGVVFGVHFIKTF